MLANAVPDFVTAPGRTIALGNWARLVSAGVQAPTIDLLALDTNAYTASDGTATGTLQGSIGSIGFTSGYGAARYIDISFTWNAADGAYENPLLGALDTLQFASPDDALDLVDFSLYAAPALPASTLAPYDTVIGQSGAYLGSTTLLSASGVVAPSWPFTTQSGIAAAAMSFIGSIANNAGCWVLASEIAALAGAPLPVTGSLGGIPGQASGEWFVAYDGPVQKNTNWIALLATGDVVSFVNPDGSGHITTVVSGSGANANVVDNASVMLGSIVLNSANDGSAADVRVFGPHPITGELNGVDPASVVIYRLDAPVVTPVQAMSAVDAGAAVPLASLFSASDPAGNAVTEYQIYDTNGATNFDVAGQVMSADLPWQPIEVGTLQNVSLLTSAGSFDDTIGIRAGNGSFWGDWTSISLAPAVDFTDQSTGATGQAVLSPIAAGGPSYLQWQYNVSSGDTMDLTCTVPNAFICGGSGGGSITVISGENVIWGGSGASFITSGSGDDTIFASLGGPGIADTIANFHAGDMLTIWGYQAGNDRTVIDSWQNGATLRLTDNAGDALGAINFVGLSPAQLAQMASYTGSSYLLMIHQ